MDLVLFFVATLLGAIVAGVAGFAFGLIASAIWLHIIPPAQSAPLIAVFAILIQGATLWPFRHAIRISRLFPFLLGSAMGIPLGAAVLTLASPDQSADAHRRRPHSVQSLQSATAQASRH
jgi:uncharacterized membrane protein YfcA